MLSQTDYGPATQAYQELLHKQGWVFLPQLPANTPLGPKVAGLPGGRSAWSPNGSQYNLAPYGVMVEMKISEQQQQQALEDLQHPYMATARETTDVIRDALVSAAEATGLDHGIGGLVAKGLGIPPWALLTVVGVVGYAVLVKYDVVPPISKVFKQ